MYSTDVSPRDGGNDLTDDELTLLHLLATGTTDEGAATKLGWHERTLRRRLNSAMRKLGARSRFEAGFLFARSISRGDEPDPV